MNTPHRLAPLLTPRSIAYVGASNREGSPGNNMLLTLQQGSFTGSVYAVNPNYEQVAGIDCFPTLSALPEVPDLVVLAVADQRLESALRDAAEVGVRAAVIFGGGNLADDTDPPLPKRLGDIARQADMPVCGASCMGFYNLDLSLQVTFGKFPYRTNLGHITLLTHSGSSWSALTLNDGRLGYNLSISTGQELNVTVADYLDYAVEQASTRIVGLILETVRDPEGFKAALEKANDRAVPVIALKIGRTAHSTRLAMSHSGAIAGDDAAYEAVFDHYGVSRVETLDELAAGLSLLSQSTAAGSGRFVSIHDSGFERELMVDLASDLGVEFADINPETTKQLASLLDPGLEPVNPLDVWGTGRDYPHVFTETFCALMSDPDTSIGCVSHSPRDQTPLSSCWADTCVEASRRHGKPVFLVTNFPWTRHPALVERLSAEGVPVIEGMSNGLAAVRCAFEQRDFRARPTVEPPVEVVEEIRDRWRARLQEPQAFDESEALRLLSDYGIPVVPMQLARGSEEACASAASMGFPVVLKTAEPGIHHKTEVDGVRIGLNSDKAVARAYADLSQRLGPRVSVSPMVREGVEMSLGMIVDEQFGPLVVVGAGGTLIEVIRDRRLGLPPFDSNYALRLIDRLQTRTLLTGHRGRPPADVTALTHAAARLSRLAYDLGDLILELDINPVIVNSDAAMAVDALVVGRKA